MSWSYDVQLAWLVAEERLFPRRREKVSLDRSIYKEVFSRLRTVMLWIF